MRKEFRAAFVAAFVALSVNGFGQTLSSVEIVTNGLSINVGDPVSVTNHLVRMCNVVFVSIYQNNQYLKGGGTPATPTEIEQLPDIALPIIVDRLNSCQNVDTNADVVCGIDFGIAGDYLALCFNVECSFRVTKDDKGYHLPTDLSKELVPVMYEWVPVGVFYNASWARAEVRDSFGGIVSEYDNYVNPNETFAPVFFNGPFLCLRKYYVIPGTFSTQSTTRIMVVDNGDYLIFDGASGRQIKETPTSLRIGARGSAIEIYGGNAYRNFSLQVANNPVGPWQEYANGTIPAHVPFGKPGVVFTNITPSGTCTFFRTVTAEKQ